MKKIAEIEPTLVACCVPITSRRLDDDDATATATVFKALADPHRVRIVNLLSNSDGPVCVCDITDHIGLSQPTVSFHLKKLVAAGVLQREQIGTWGFYSVNKRAMKQLMKVFQT